MSQVKVSSIYDKDGGSNAVLYGVAAPTNGLLFRNRIINGDMRIDQRNAGATGTASGYTVDRWRFFGSQATKITWGRNYGSVSLPAGFTNYLGFKTTTAYTSAAGDRFMSYQPIEGFNVADLGWGTANAKSVTISFVVYSNVTGTHSGSVINGANNRSYPFTFTVSSANTFETKSVTIPGDTTGTWPTDNTESFGLYFNLGCGSTYLGTANAWAAGYYIGATGSANIVGTLDNTFYITGVQLEVGSVATPFERRPYGTELMLCQRYFSKSYEVNTAPGTNTGLGCFSLRQWDTTSSRTSVPTPTRYPVAMRTAPTLTLYSINGNSGNISESGGSDSNATNRAVSSIEGQGSTGFSGLNLSAGISAGQFYNWHYAASAEL